MLNAAGASNPAPQTTSGSLYEPPMAASGHERRLSKSLLCIAIVTDNHARLFGFFLQLLDDIGVVDLAIRAVVPRDAGSLEPLRSTHSSGMSPSTSTSWGVPLILT